MANMGDHFAVHTRDIFYYYKEIMANKGNLRVKAWPLMNSPVPTLCICLSYIYFCKVVGPMMMKHRQSFQLQYLMIIYNCLQTILNGWIFYECLQSGWLKLYSFRSQTFVYDEYPIALLMASTCWWYLLSKFTEMLDTVILILRKKFYRVSDMHILHRALMPISVWVGLRFARSDHSTLFALVNSFVHVGMYFYHMLAAMGPRLRPFLRWKNYLAILQVLQFLIIMGHQTQLTFTEYNNTKGIVLWICLHAMFLLFLLFDFYKNYMPSLLDRVASDTCTYITTPESSEQQSESFVDKLKINLDKFHKKIGGLRDKECNVALETPQAFVFTEELPVHEKEELQ